MKTLQQERYITIKQGCQQLRLEICVGMSRNSSTVEISFVFSSTHIYANTISCSVAHALIMCIGSRSLLLLSQTVFPSMLMILLVSFSRTFCAHCAKHFLNASESIHPHTRTNVVSDGIPYSGFNYICSRSHDSLLRQKSSISSRPSQFPITAAIVMQLFHIDHVLLELLPCIYYPAKAFLHHTDHLDVYSTSLPLNPFGNTFVTSVTLPQFHVVAVYSIWDYIEKH